MRQPPSCETPKRHTYQTGARVKFRKRAVGLDGARRCMVDIAFIFSDA